MVLHSQFWGRNLCHALSNTVLRPRIQAWNAPLPVMQLTAQPVPFYAFVRSVNLDKDLLPKTLADLINVRGAVYLASSEACKETGIDIPRSQSEVWLLKDEPSRGVTTG